MARASMAEEPAALAGGGAECREQHQRSSALDDAAEQGQGRAGQREQDPEPELEAGETGQVGRASPVAVATWDRADTMSWTRAPVPARRVRRAAAVAVGELLEIRNVPTASEPVVLRHVVGVRHDEAVLGCSRPLRHLTEDVEVDRSVGVVAAPSAA